MLAGWFVWPALKDDFKRDLGFSFAVDDVKVYSIKYEAGTGADLDKCPTLAE